MDKLLPGRVRRRTEASVLARIGDGGATDVAALASLRDRYPAAVDDIETTYKVMSIDGPDADALLRSWESRTALASIRRAEMLRATSPEAAADVLSDATARWHDPRLLLMAVDCYVDAGEWDKADPLAARVIAESGTLWPGRMSVLRRMMLIQYGTQNWPRLATTCEALLEVDQNDDEARWGLAYAQFRNGDPERAWATLNRPRPISATKSTAQRACFYLELSRRYADAEALARDALQILAAFADDHDVHASVILSITLRADRTELPDDVGAEVTAAWESFAELYPDSTAIMRYTMREDSDNPLADLEPHLRQEALAYAETIKYIREQVVPIGLLERVVRKPYSAIFVYRPLGYHAANSVWPQDVAIELDAARLATTKPCFVDASALYTLALIPDLAETLVTMTQRPTVTDSAVNDLIAAEDMLSGPTAGTLAFDLEGGQIIASPTDPDIRQRQQAQVRAMLFTARRLRRVIHPSLVHLAALNDLGSPVWLLTLDAAKSGDGVVWTDDLGLRRLAHSLGIKTFGTWALASLAFEAKRITAAEVTASHRQLVTEHVVDLPFDSAALMSIAEEQEWQPQSVATVLSRSAAWINFQVALQLFRTIFRKAPDDSLSIWGRAAVQGLSEASLPDRKVENLTRLTAIALGDGWSRPGHAAAIVEAIRRLSPEHVVEITEQALSSVWTFMTKQYGARDASVVFLHVIGSLDDRYRQFGVGLILGGDDEQAA